MAKLSEDLKRMLTGLAYQDVGDFLSINEKMKVLDNGTENPGTENQESVSQRKPAADTPYETEPSHFEIRAATKRIAYISNGGGLDTPLDYVIDNCLLQNAQIDLLLHGVTDMANISALEKKIQNAGISFKRIQLEANAVDSIVDYIAKQTSLIFLVAMPDDAVAKVLIEEVLPKRGSRIQAPLVLIKDQLSASTHRQSAA